MLATGDAVCPWAVVLPVGVVVVVWISAAPQLTGANVSVAVLDDDVVVESAVVSAKGEAS